MFRHTQCMTSRKKAAQPEPLLYVQYCHQHVPVDLQVLFNNSFYQNGGAFSSRFSQLAIFQYLFSLSHIATHIVLQLFILIMHVCIFSPLPCTLLMLLMLCIMVAYVKGSYCHFFINTNTPSLISLGCPYTRRVTGQLLPSLSNLNIFESIIWDADCLSNLTLRSNQLPLCECLSLVSSQ